MLKMNRQDQNTKKYKIKKSCCNYNTDSTCDGVIIGSKLQQWVDSSKVGKKCLVVDNKECDYYNRCIKPLAK